jgi:hypothetical protein
VDEQRVPENVDAPEDFVPLREAVAICGVSRRTFTAWAQAGKLIAVLTPEGRSFRRSAIESAAAHAGDDDYPLQ